MPKVLPHGLRGLFSPAIAQGPDDVQMLLAGRFEAFRHAPEVEYLRLSPQCADDLRKLGIAGCISYAAMQTIVDIANGDSVRFALPQAAIFDQHLQRFAKAVEQFDRHASGGKACCFRLKQQADLQRIHVVFDTHLLDLKPTAALTDEQTFTFEHEKCIANWRAGHVEGLGKATLRDHRSRWCHARHDQIEDLLVGLQRKPLVRFH